MLQEKDNLLICQCGASYQIIDGIPIFSEIDPFYEGVWKEGFRDPHDFAGRIYLALSMDTWPRRYRFIRKCLHGVPGGLLVNILDIGCGGGNDIFPKKGKTVGCDISLASLRKAKEYYSQCVQMDITKPFPFESETLSFISCVEVLEHLSGQSKGPFLKEIHRVLTRGGRAVFTFQAVGWCHKFARILSEEYYKKYFVEPFGHIGLEYSTQAKKRLKDQGFRIVALQKHFSLIFPTGMLLQYFDNEYRKRSFLIDIVLRFIVLFSRFPRLAEGFNFIIGHTQGILEIFLPFNAGSNIFILCEKK